MLVPAATSRPNLCLPSLRTLCDVLREPSDGASDWYLGCADAVLNTCSGCKLATQDVQMLTQERPRPNCGPLTRISPEL
jgi:hypothetical protein